MAHSSSALQDANALGPLLDKRKLSRRTLLRNMAGLALTGGSLTSLATACGFAPGASPASQPTASHVLGTTIFTYRGHSGGVLAVAWSPEGKRIASVVRIRPCRCGMRQLGNTCSNIAGILMV